MNIMNIGGVHDNGEPRLQIGMSKNKGFVIEYDTTLNMIALKDATSGATLPILAPSASPFTFCGQYSTYTDLTNAVTAGTITPSKGDVYSIKTAGGTDGNGTSISALDIVAYGNDNKWYIIGNGNS